MYYTVDIIRFAKVYWLNSLFNFSFGDLCNYDLSILMVLVIEKKKVSNQIRQGMQK